MWHKMVRLNMKLIVKTVKPLLWKTFDCNLCCRVFLYITFAQGAFFCCFSSERENFLKRNCVEKLNRDTSRKHPRAKARWTFERLKTFEAALEFIYLFNEHERTIIKKRGMTKSLGVKGAKILVMIVKVTLDYSVNTSIRLRQNCWWWTMLWNCC